MTHSINNADLSTEIIIDETLCENVSITINNYNEDTSITHYLNRENLQDFISALSYVSDKKNRVFQDELTKCCNKIRLTDGDNFKY